MDKDFTLKKYKSLCKFMLSTGKDIVRLKDYLINKKTNANKKIILLRHDVDIFPRKALMMAKIEKDLRIKSTYYFRTRNYVYNENIIKQIKSLGHEIGYHYETLSDSKGDYKEAINLFGRHIDKFNSLTKINTASMHGSSMSRYNNLDMWDHCLLSDFDLIGEAYLSIDWNDFCYFTDAGGSWNSKANFRDKSLVPNNSAEVVNSTDELMELIPQDINFYINIHPDRWNDGISWYIEAMTKRIRNRIKIIHHNFFRK
jgi:hypothetical protein